MYIKHFFKLCGLHYTKMKFSIKEFFSKCDQIHRKLQIWSHLLKKSLMENFIFCGELRLFATEILRYQCNSSHFGFTCVFFLKNLTFLFWRLKAIKRNLYLKENLFIARSMKIHSCENLVLCYYFKFFILFPLKRIQYNSIKTKRLKLHFKKILFLAKSMKTRFGKKFWFYFVIFKYFSR